jgi:hypothetical protein
MKVLSFISNNRLLAQMAQKENAPPIEIQINFIRLIGSYEENGVMNKVVEINENGIINSIFE